VTQAQGTDQRNEIDFPFLNLFIPQNHSSFQFSKAMQRFQTVQLAFNFFFTKNALQLPSLNEYLLISWKQV